MATESKATFGAGCSWGVEAAYRTIDGMKATAVGYLGGSTEQPTSGRHRRLVVTEITDATTFWPAKDHHQQYLEKRGLATCRI